MLIIVHKSLHISFIDSCQDSGGQCISILSVYIFFDFRSLFLLDTYKGPETGGSTRKSLRGPRANGGPEGLKGAPKGLNNAKNANKEAGRRKKRRAPEGPSCAIA